MDGIDWNDLRLILAVGRTGSLAGAARELKHDHSTIFRKLNAIEKRVGVRFFERVNGRYDITDAGAAALKVAESFENDVLGLERQIVGQDTRLQGNIRISAPEGPSILSLPPILAEFRKKHPGVTLDLVSEFGPSDLSRREADIAVRITKSPPESHLGRYVCDFAIGVFASRDYLARAGSRALVDHDWVVFQPTEAWKVPLIFPNIEAVHAKTVVRTNSTQSALALTRAGCGVAALPVFLCDADPTLVRVVDPFPVLTMEVWVLMHPDLRNTTRIKVLVDFLARELRLQRRHFEGHD